jgi:hypothetical protein
MLFVRRLFCLMIFLLLYTLMPFAQDSRAFKVFQFPPNMIPSIDAKTNDWDIVGEEYSVGMDQLIDNRDSGAHKMYNPKDLDVKVKVGWVKGMNRLYFLYQAYDNYWDFSLPDLHNDIFELVVDGDRSGGPLISNFHAIKNMDPMEAYFSFQGVQAQNYHIYTPALGKEWAFVWGSQSWIKNLPYANAAYDYKFSPGDSGRLTVEFWITAFDYAGYEGPSRAVESVLSENKTIGLSWAIIDYDNVNTKGNHNNNGFWTLSKERKMYGDASFLLPFQLMPLEKKFLKPIAALWSFSILDMNHRTVAFTDESVGKIASWKWDFGDGKTSAEQHPIHVYDKPGMYIVVLWVEGPAGKSRMAKVWDVAVK